MYNGLGARVAVSVAGQMTRYTLDHAARNRILAESTPTHTVLYLYSGGGTGTDVCLGEIRAGVPRYYLPDAAGYVRQGVDTDGAVASSWLFDPDGTVLEGPDGPVSHLVCGGVYDSSTGLLYQGGSYFDPRLGIWLALLPLVVLQAWPGRKKKKYNGTLWGILLIGIAGGMLTACGNDGEDLLKFGEEICAEMPSVDYKLSVKLPEPQVYNGEYWGDPEMWQARLGNKQNATLETGCDNNAVLILGEVTTDPPISSAPGYIRFEQHVSYQHIYHFGKSDRQTTDSITAGDLNTWYIDGGESPYLDSDGTKTGNLEQCTADVCGFMIDAPGEALRQMHKDSYAPLVKYERYEQFRTYLLWYPVSGCRIPIARIDWSWSIIAEASPANDPLDNYPWKWERVDWETDPEAGEELLIEGTIKEQEPYYPLNRDKATDFIAEDTPDISGLDWWSDAGYR